MPYKFETNKLKIPKELDKRVRLTEEEREQIIQLGGKISQRKLAKKYKVSRRLIQFVLYPEKYEKSKQQTKINRLLNNNYYEKERNTKYMKKHRTHKQTLMKQRKLIKNEKFK